MREPKTTLTVQQVIDTLSTVENKNSTCFVWINSQIPEPIYTGCDRIPIVHIDMIQNGDNTTVDMCAESYQQTTFQDRIYNKILSEKYDISKTRELLIRLITMIDKHDSLKEMKIAWLNLAKQAVDKLDSDFMMMKKLLNLRYDSPSTEQIVEYIDMYIKEPNISICRDTSTK